MAKKNAGKITDEMWKDFEEIIHDIVELSTEHPDGWRGVKEELDRRLEESDDYHIGEFFNWYGAEYPGDDGEEEDSDIDDSDIEYGGESGEEN